MISLQAYRATIGSFVTKARHIQRSSSHFLRLNRTNKEMFVDTPNYFNCVNDQYATKYFLRALGVVILVLIVTLNLNFSVLKLLKFKFKVNYGTCECNKLCFYRMKRVVLPSIFKFLDRTNKEMFVDTPNYFNCVNDQYATKYFLRALGVVILVLIVTLNLNFSILKLLKLLTDGDVESNPGPTFKILKVIQGSFHQGHPKFGHTAGIQCACNSFYALCWSTIKRVSVWTTSDLDYVLENGDSLFKSINTNMALNVDELPVNVNIEGHSLDVILLENEAGVMKTTEQFNFLKMSFQTKTNTGTGAIFFINGTHLL